MQRTISFERNARVAYEAAAEALAQQATEIILDENGTLALDAELAGFSVSRPVAATTGELRQLDPHAVVLPLAWEAAKHPRRFPTFEGILEISALADHPAQTRVALVGTVRPPLGVLGTLGEAAGGTQVGDGVLEALLDRIVQRLLSVVAARQSTMATATAGTHLARPRFVPED